MPDFKHLMEGRKRPAHDPREYGHSVRFDLPDTGLKGLSEMAMFYSERGLRQRTATPHRRSVDYLKALYFLFPDEAMAREFQAKFGGDYQDAKKSPPSNQG